MNLEPELEEVLKEHGLTVHPVCALFPLITPDEMHSLVSDIEQTGLQHPLMRVGSVLLDGRNRLIACKRAKVEPRFEEYTGDRPSRWILSTNIERRSLTDDQACAIGIKALPNVRSDEDARRAKLESQFKPGICPNPTGRRGKQVNMKSGSPVKRDTKKMHANSTVGKLAAELGVSEYKAGQAKAILDAIESGVISATIVDDLVSGKVKLRETVNRIPGKPRKKKGNVDKFITLWKKCSEDERNQIRKMLQ